MVSNDAELAFVANTDFDTLPGSPTYYQPGRNPTIEDASIDNALAPLREPGNAEAVEQLAGRFEGAFSASWVLSQSQHDQVRNIVYNDGSSPEAGFDVSNDPATSTWYLGLDYDSSTAERELRSVTPTEHSISYDEGSNTVTESLTAVYADENLNASITPSSINKAADGDEAPFHGFSVDIDSTTITKLRSATLTVSNIAALVTGTSRKAVDNRLAAPEITLETTGRYEDDDHLEYAYGSSGATTPDTSAINNQSATVTIDNAAGTKIASYSLPEVKPANYSWQDLINRDQSMSEPITWNASGSLSIS